MLPKVSVENTTNSNRTEPFDVIFNEKPVFNRSEDKSGFAHLKLLYLHFPEDVTIIDIDIVNIERTAVDSQTNDLTQTEYHYFAFVYTSGETYIR